MKQITYYILLCMLFTMSACKNNTAETTDQKNANDAFGKYCSDFIQALWKQNPEWASATGYHAYDSLYSENTIEAMRKGVAWNDEWNKRLEEIQYDSLSSGNQVDYRILQNQFKSAHFYFDTYKSYEWDPTSYNIGGMIDATLNHQKLPLNKRLNNLNARLQYVPAYYKNAQSQLKECTHEHCALAIQQNTGALWFFDYAFPDSLKKSSLSDAQRALFEKNSALAKQAVLDYVAFLEKEKLPNAKKSPRVGKDIYLQKFAYEIQSDRSADEIFKDAMDRKAYLHMQMAKISMELWPKYMHATPVPADTLKLVRAMIDKLSEKHCKPEDFMTTIEKQLPELTAFIEQKDLVTMDKTKPLKVRKTPEYMAGVAGASINSPGPYDTNATTYYNVTPLTRYSPAEAESYLREYNDYVLQILNIHEAIPGHYTQLIYSNRSPSLIKSVFGNGTMVEGWACYVERMMIEEGYNQSPEMQLFYYKWNLRECTNMILDYSVHCNNMSEEQAMHLLADEAFQQSAEAKEKFHRAMVTNVQLSSYYTGLSEIYQLREDYRKQEGQHFSLKKFHETFLSYGSAPVRLIRDMMLR